MRKKGLAMGNCPAATLFDREGHCNRSLRPSHSGLAHIALRSVDLRSIPDSAGTCVAVDDRPLYCRRRTRNETPALLKYTENTSLLSVREHTTMVTITYEWRVAC